MTRSTLHRPALVATVALLALCVACGGSAAAATSDAGHGPTAAGAAAKKKKAKPKRGKHGARGPRGAQGPRGEQGPPGARGGQGAQGPAGPIGPSNAFEAHNDAGVSGAADTDKTVATLANLPAGAYAISAKVTLTRGAPAGLHVAACTLTAGDDSDGSQALAPDSTGIGATVTTQLTHTFAATGTATLSCTMIGAAWNATRAKIVAIKVGSETKTAVTG